MRRIRQRGLVLAVAWIVAMASCSRPAPPGPPVSPADDEVAPEPPPSPVDWVEPDIYPERIAQCDLLGDDSCGVRCIAIMTTLIPEAAQRTYDCFMEAHWIGESSYCDGCTVRGCIRKAFEGSPPREPDPRCSGELVVAFGADASRAGLFREACLEHTPYMNDVGRDRYLACQQSQGPRGLNQWWCLWDPFLDPCGEVAEMKRRMEGDHDAEVLDVDDPDD